VSSSIFCACSLGLPWTCLQQKERHAKHEVGPHFVIILVSFLTPTSTFWKHGIIVGAHIFVAWQLSETKGFVHLVACSSTLVVTNLGVNVHCCHIDHLHERRSIFLVYFKHYTVDKPLWLKTLFANNSTPFSQSLRCLHYTIAIHIVRGSYLSKSSNMLISALKGQPITH
jgi:hypothetical protein